MQVIERYTICFSNAPFPKPFDIFGGMFGGKDVFMHLLLLNSRGVLGDLRYRLLFFRLCGILAPHLFFGRYGLKGPRESFRGVS